MSRILRCLVCFFLICSLLVNLLPVRSDATAAGLAGIIGASTVTVSAPLVIGAAAIVLGVMAKNTNPLVFENTVNDAVASLSAAGTWVKDGAVELLQTIDETGQKAYYVAGDMLEDVRSWISTNVFSDATPSFITSSRDIKFYNQFMTNAKTQGYIERSSYCLITFNSSGLKLMGWTPGRLVLEGQRYKAYYPDGSSAPIWCIQTNGTNVYVEGTMSPWTGSGGAADIICGASAYGLALGDYEFGSIPYAGSFTDGSSALEWAEEYARKALKVIEGGNDPDPDSQPPNDGKWFWPLALGLTVGVLGTMSQADEWSGQTPQEFNDYSTKTEFEILSRPEFDSWQGIEIAPVTQPNPDPDPGTDPGTNPPAPGEPSPDPDPEPEPDPEPNPGTDPDADPDAEPKTISDIWQSIKELPSKITDAFSQKAPASNMSNFTLDLSKYFPFCIPFDMYDFFTCLRADPVAPVIKWEIYLPGGEPYPLEIDLSPFDSVAQLLRTLQLLLFCVGLAFKTRDLIKG